MFLLTEYRKTRTEARRLPFHFIRVLPTKRNNPNSIYLTILIRTVPSDNSRDVHRKIGKFLFFHLILHTLFHISADLIRTGIFLRIACPYDLVQFRVVIVIAGILHRALSEKLQMRDEALVRKFALVNLNVKSITDNI